MFVLFSCIIVSLKNAEEQWRILIFFFFFFLKLCPLLSRRASFPSLDFPYKPSPRTLTRRIHHTCLRSAVSQWKLPSSAKTWGCRVKHRAWVMFLRLSSRSGDGLQGLRMFQCCRLTEVDKSDRREEIQVYDTTHESLPLRSLLSSNDQLLFIWLQLHMKKLESVNVFVDKLIKCSISPLVTLWWALEKRRTEEVLTTGPDMAVGGLADTAHGSAGLHIDGPYHQHTETGD